MAVEVDEVVVQNIKDLNRLKADMDLQIQEAGAPEDVDQFLCDCLALEVRKIFKTRKQDNIGGQADG